VQLLWLARPDVAEAFAAHRRGCGPAVPLWSLASHSPIYRRMRDALAGLDLPETSLNLSNNARMMVDIAKAGGGLGVFPESMVREELKRGELVQLADMPKLDPVYFLVAVRAAEQDPILLRIFEQASSLNLLNMA
jgi:DNA-binding transcriptional LysR family regulator